MSGSKTSSLQDKEFQIGDVKVTISAAWVRRINSPLMYVISALTGVSVTFMPVNLFWLGQAQAGYRSPWVWLCFAIIWLVPGFYMGLAGHVLRQVQEKTRASKLTKTVSSGEGAET